MYKNRERWQKSEEDRNKEMNIKKQTESDRKRKKQGEMEENTRKGQKERK